MPARRSSPIRTRFPSPRIDDQPIAAINTTPLIDLMLVLIIMFIVTIPMREHKVPLDLPRPASSPETPPPVHRLDLDAAGRPFWDGAAVSPPALRARLAALAADPARPVLSFNPDDAVRYERVDEMLAEIRAAGIRRLGLPDGGRFASALSR